jgi:Na+-transporting NADH:ubiquinone oxidoreductase subunit NqrC
VENGEEFFLGMELLKKQEDKQGGRKEAVELRAVDCIGGAPLTSTGFDDSLRV